MCNVAEIKARLTVAEGDFFNLVQKLGGALARHGIVLTCFGGYQGVGGSVLFRLKTEGFKDTRVLVALVDVAALGAAKQVEVYYA